MTTHPAKPTGKPIDIEALHADIQRRFPKTLEALRQSELADFDLEGLRVTEEICADRIARLCQENADKLLTTPPYAADPVESLTLVRLTQPRPSGL